MPGSHWLQCKKTKKQLSQVVMGNSFIFSSSIQEGLERVWNTAQTSTWLTSMGALVSHFAWSPLSPLCHEDELLLHWWFQIPAASLFHHTMLLTWRCLLFCYYNYHMVTYLIWLSLFRFYFSSPLYPNENLQKYLDLLADFWLNLNSR